MKRRRTRDEAIIESFADLERLAAYVPTPAPTCDSCKNFTPDSINPPAGMGSCAKGHMAIYPMQRRSCTDYQSNSPR